MNSRIFRSLDIVLALFGLLLLFPVLIILSLLVFLDTGTPILIQTRIGRAQTPFNLIKFPTLRGSNEPVPTHMEDKSKLTSLGKKLRRFKLDELPQLWNVLCGEMALVGPRPCLPVQREVVEAREALGVNDVLPGITGLAQINRIDMSTPDLLAECDTKMINEFSLKTYFSLLLLTVIGKGSGDRTRA